MKKLQQLFLFALGLGLFSCATEEAVLDIDTFTEFSVPAGLNTIEAHYFLNFDVPIPFDRLTDEAGIDKGNITQFVPTRGTLIAARNTSADLQSIRSVNVFVLDPSNPDRRLEVYYMELVEPGPKTEINLFNTIRNLQSVITDDLATMEVRLEFVTPPRTTMELRLDMTFGVFAE